MLDFIYKRHSVREFKDEDIPMEDLEKIILAATQAPSGNNKQNWHFVVVNNKEKLNDIADIVEKKAKELAAHITDDNVKKKFLSGLSYHTFFKNAPAAVFVFAGPYNVSSVEIYKYSNPTEEEVNKLFNFYPGIQGIGAAMENLLLAAANMGYGGCWMTGPLYAKYEIKDYLGLDKEGFDLACITPIGVPVSSDLKSPPRKPLSEVATFIK